MYETDEQKAERAANNRRFKAQEDNLKGRCPKCEGKFLPGQTVAEFIDRELGNILVHDQCVDGPDVLYRDTWIQY